METLLEYVFSNMYFKFAIASLMSLILTFIHDINVVKKIEFIYVILTVGLMMLVFINRDDIGILYLAFSIFLISYNMRNQGLKYIL